MILKVLKIYSIYISSPLSIPSIYVLLKKGYANETSVFVYDLEMNILMITLEKFQVVWELSRGVRIFTPHLKTRP